MLLDALIPIYLNLVSLDAARRLAKTNSHNMGRIFSDFILIVM